jgi:transcriptional regulator with XRE-family HTH domain
MSDRTLGKIIAQRRAAMGLSLKELGHLVHKEDGVGISAQYLHDIERDRRTPSPQVLGELARALNVEVHYLEAVAGQCPADVVGYLRDHPELAEAISRFFATARISGFADWESLTRALTPGRPLGVAAAR